MDCCCIIEANPGDRVVDRLGNVRALLGSTVILGLCDRGEGDEDARFTGDGFFTSTDFTMSPFFIDLDGCSDDGFDAVFRFAESGGSVLALDGGFFFVGEDGLTLVWWKVYPRSTDSSFCRSGSSSV
jgi:hypothetical protein